MESVHTQEAKSEGSSEVTPADAVDKDSETELFTMLSTHQLSDNGMYVHTYVCMYVGICLHAYMYICTNVYMHNNIHNTYTVTYICFRIQMNILVFRLPYHRKSAQKNICELRIGS